jgi:hypothetical protein
MSTIFWDIMLCSPLSVNWRFEGTYRLHLQGRKNKLSMNQHESRCGGDMFLQNSMTTWRYIPDDGIHNHRDENLKSNPTF